MYEYSWIPAGLVSPDLVNEMAELYSEHYGLWGPRGRKPGGKIKLSPERIRGWLSPQSRLAWATAFGQLIGYAIVAQVKLPGYGVVSWVTQLVVHEEHRQSDVGKTLLFTAWHFTDHFAWGLTTANPYAVRALEKATRRRCSPVHIRNHRNVLMKLGPQVVPYISTATETKIGSAESRINTRFFLDHASLSERLRNATGEGKPWLLGGLDEGWEWLAFTFHEQGQIGLTNRELEQMLLASDSVTKQAYSRMLTNGRDHAWARHTDQEVRFITEACSVGQGSLLLDIGCGKGRHAIGLHRTVHCRGSETRLRPSSP